MTTSRIRKVAWLHVEDRKLLCVRSQGKDVFYVPGGKPEAGESNVAALLREISEELNVALDPASLSPAGEFTAPADGKADALVIVEAYRASHQGDFRPSGEIAEYRFMSSADADRVSAVTRAILQHLEDSHVIS